MWESWSPSFPSQRAESQTHRSIASASARAHAPAGFFPNICNFLVPPFTKMGTTGARRQGNRKPEKYNPVITC